MIGILVFIESSSEKLKEYAMVLWENLEYDDIGIPLPAKPPYDIPVLMDKGKIVATVKDLSPLQLSNIAKGNIKQGDIIITRYKI